VSTETPQSPSDAFTEADYRWMRMALRMAEEASQAGEVPVGAVLIDDSGQLLARDRNRVEQLHDVTAHAEIMVCTAASYALQGKYLPQCTLYVTLEPCVMCAGALKWFQLGRIVYGADDVKGGFRRLASDAVLHKRTACVGGCLAQESAALLRGFFQRRR